MPPTYTVRARVIDVRTDAPRATDRFAVDTNVWAWEHYPGSRYTSSGVMLVQASDYLPYLQLTRDVGAIRYRVVASLAELAHVIEQSEHALYTGSVAPMAPKDYRHNVPSERARVVAEIQQAWGLIEGDSDLLPLALDDSLAGAALARLASAPVDGYDLFLLEAMHSASVMQLLSDDGDCSGVADIDLFTANPRVLAAARAQGRLAAR